MNRRSFLSRIPQALLALGIGSSLNLNKLFAADALKCVAKDKLKGKVDDAKVLDETSASAKRLNYVADATTSTHKKYVKGDNCLNCSFYTKDKEVESYAPCKMLANKFVSQCGWCQSYKRKA